MCVGAPKIKAPTNAQQEPVIIPERQPQKLPDSGATDLRSDLLARRRRGLAAMILTSPGGLLGVPSTGSLGGGNSG